MAAPFWPKGLSPHLSVPQTSVYYNLEVSATRFPEKDAVVFYDTRISYRALRQDVDRLAGFLQRQCGIGRGDRVLLYMQNSPQFIVAYYAILRADAVVVPVSPGSVTPELAGYIADSGAEVALVGQELFPQIQPHIGTTSLKNVIVAAYSDYTKTTDARVLDFVKEPRRALSGAGVTLWTDALAADLAPGEHRAGPDDVCVMPYTSGTTGKPKGCVHLHRSVMMTAATHNSWLGMWPDTVVLAVLPFFHVTGMQTGMNAPILCGNTIVLLARWHREIAAEMVERYRVSAWTNIATMVIDFLMNPKVGDYDLSSIACIGGGGAAMPEAIAKKLQDVCGLTYVEGYGLTETIAPTHMNPPARPKAQCLGIPIFDTDVRVIDPETLVELGPNEVGEIVCRGPQVFQGYWQNPQATEEAFIDIDGKRFFRTGDLGRVDDEGYYFLVDRLKRMINAAGFKIWPAEVEATLYQNPDIQQVCVVRTQDEYRGEAAKAIVVLKPERRGQVTGEDIIKWCEGRMDKRKWPRTVEFRESLPMSPTGKVQWRVLQEESALP